MAAGNDGAGGARMSRESKFNGLFFLVGTLLLWELVSRAGWANPLILPPVSRIFASFGSLLSSGQIPAQILVSLRRAALGYGLAAIVFIPLGVLMGLFDRLHRALEVVIEMLRPIPPPVVIPVAMLFFGLEDQMKVFVIFFSCAWPILLNTLDGVRNIDRVLLHTARTFGLSQGQIIWRVILPACSPQVMTGLRVSLPITLILVVISEMVGSTDGIGYFVLDSQRRFRVAQMYAGMLSLALLGYALNQLFNFLQRKLLGWHWRQLQKG
jgi:ABC-type nitrate/sulfonate/bicarbonate transport system permease component